MSRQVEPYRSVLPPRDPDHTEVIVIPPPLVDPFPPPPQPHGRRRDGDGRSLLARAVQCLAVAAVATVAFVAGQISASTGAVPPPPMPAAAAEVVTTSQMARVWPQVTPDDQRAQCGPWSRGAWREYVTDRWAQHLASPAGGGIDVDRTAVVRFLNRACARRL